MGLHTFSLDDDIMEKFDEKTDNGKKSQAIENLIREHYLGEEAKSQPVKFIDYSGLTRNRKQLAQEIIDIDNTPISKPKLFKKVNNKAIYSKKESYKQGLNALHHNSSVPIKLENGKVTKGEKECVSCGATVTYGILENNGYECAGCGQKYEV